MNASVASVALVVSVVLVGLVILVALVNCIVKEAYMHMVVVGARRSKVVVEGAKTWLVMGGVLAIPAYGFVAIVGVWQLKVGLCMAVAVQRSDGLCMGRVPRKPWHVRPERRGACELIA